ncbi:hypothetical protein [Thioalkalivibrio sulfidiphilus]|uniref:hypothetical protein n=1 Tax=Thioalkalivibrio sulfidiphilus TaxID=1033854 RepID=UPI0012DBFBFD|nr:hypothetical protein [Thioalkalivibrio sulfidiphilus]
MFITHLGDEHPRPVCFPVGAREVAGFSISHCSMTKGELKMNFAKWGVGAASTALVFGGLVTGCGGGSSDGPSGTELSTGVFVDAPVIGLDYSQDGRSGSTDDDGQFFFDPAAGDITFSVGDINIGAVPGASRVTPYDFGDETVAVNIAQFLQSLDEDGEPGNGIDVSGAAAMLTDLSLEFTLSAEDFEVALQSVMENSGLLATGYSVVDRESAQHALELGTEDKFNFAEIDNRVFYYQIGDSTSLDDRGIIIFQLDGAERFGGLDSLSDFEENGGDGYGVEFTWDINGDGQIELFIDGVDEDRDIITRLSAVSVPDSCINPARFYKKTAYIRYDLPVARLLLDLTKCEVQKTA